MIYLHMINLSQILFFLKIKKYLVDILKKNKLNIFNLFFTKKIQTNDLKNHIFSDKKFLF